MSGRGCETVVRQCSQRLGTLGPLKLEFQVVSCELPDRRAGNQTWAFSENSMHSYPLSHFSSSLLNFTFLVLGIRFQTLYMLILSLPLSYTPSCSSVF